VKKKLQEIITNFFTKYFV